MRAARVDANQAEIVAALRAIGCSVQPLHKVGDGCPDLLVGAGRWNILIEVKDGDKPLSERRLTPMQKSWHANWLGRVHIAQNVDQALAIVYFYRKAKML